MSPALAATGTDLERLNAECAANPTYTYTTTDTSGSFTDNAGNSWPAYIITTSYVGYYDTSGIMGEVKDGVCRSRYAGSSSTQVRDYIYSGSIDCVREGVVKAAGPFTRDMKLRPDIDTARGTDNKLTLYTGSTPFGNNPSENWGDCVAKGGRLEARIEGQMTTLDGKTVSARSFFGPLGRYLVYTNIKSSRVNYITYGNLSVFGSRAGQSAYVGRENLPDSTDTYRFTHACANRYISQRDSNKGWDDEEWWYTTDCGRSDGPTPPPPPEPEDGCRNRTECDTSTPPNDPTDGVNIITCTVAGDTYPVYRPGVMRGQTLPSYKSNTLGQYRGEWGWVYPPANSSTGQSGVMELRANNTLATVDYLRWADLRTGAADGVTVTDGSAQWGTRFDLSLITGQNSPSLTNSIPGLVNSQDQPYTVAPLAKNNDDEWYSPFRGAVGVGKNSINRLDLNTWHGVGSTADYNQVTSWRMPGFAVAFSQEGVEGRTWQVTPRWAYSAEATFQAQVPVELGVNPGLVPTVTDWGTQSVTDVLISHGCAGDKSTMISVLRPELALN